MRGKGGEGHKGKEGHEGGEEKKNGTKGEGEGKEL